MADITAKLLWYRFGETCTNMGERYEKFLEWYEQFSWRRVDVLDMLFLGWLLAAFLVVGCINLYLRFFGRPRSKTGPGGGLLGPGSGGLLAGGAADGEQCQWINSTISWLYLHYDNTPEIVESWLKALNDAARKQTGDVQVRFERIQPGSLPPKFTRIKTEVGPRDTLTVLAGVELSDLCLLLSTLQDTGTNVKVTNSDVTINKLHGQLKVFSQYVNNQIEVSSSFATKPDVKMTVKSRNLESQGLDARKLEAIVREAIGNAVTAVHVSPKGGYPVVATAAPLQDRIEAHQSLPVLSAAAGRGGGARDQTRGTAPTTPQTLNLQSTTSATNGGLGSDVGGDVMACSSEPAVTRSYTSKLSVGSAPRPTSLRDRRLLVKVIKANGLGNKQYGSCDPYCIVQMDDPAQKHTTAVVKNTVNPFWDEHFLFDLDDSTRQIRFNLFDREKPPGDDQLGHAVLPMAELRKTQSSRQILPLQGRPGGREGAAGSLTAEFLFMEPAEAQQMAAADASHMSDTMSPRRRIETQRTLMPGGTVVTTTTMTTEKQRDQRLDASFTEPEKKPRTETSNVTEDTTNREEKKAHRVSAPENPNKIQKTDSTSNFRSESSPYSSRSSAYGMEQSTSGSQAPGAYGSQQATVGSPQLMVTSPTPQPDSSRTMPYHDTSAPATPTRPQSSPCFRFTPRLKRKNRHKSAESLRGPKIEISMSDHSPIDDSRSLETTSQASQDPRDMKKSKSFASAIRKRFSRPKKPRSHSADRAGSLRDANLLKPPENTTKTTGAGQSKDDLDTAELPEGTLRKSRSHSFSSSLRRIFKKKKKDGEPSSRASSISRMSSRGYEYDAGQAGGRDDPLGTADYSRDHYNTMYSTSVPASSPLYDH